MFQWCYGGLRKHEMKLDKMMDSRPIAETHGSVDVLPYIFVASPGRVLGLASMPRDGISYLTSCPCSTPLQEERITLWTSALQRTEMAA